MKFVPTESASFDHKTGIGQEISRERTNWQAWGAVKGRRIYGWTWRNVVMHEKKK